MLAIILAGGKGTRLRELYDDRPKALVPVAGKPFVEYQLDWLRSQGITRVHFSAGFMADQLQAWIDKRQDDDFTLSLFAETEARGTGGALQANREMVGKDPFLVLNGDSLCPQVSIPSLVALRQETNCTGALAVTWIEDAGRFGTVRISNDAALTAFEEKQHAASGFVNCGIYCLHPSILSAIPASGSCSIETDVFPGLAGEHRLRALRTSSILLDMGTPEGLSEMEAWVQQGL